MARTAILESVIEIETARPHAAKSEVRVRIVQADGTPMEVVETHSYSFSWPDLAD